MKKKKKRPKKKFLHFKKLFLQSPETSKNIRYEKVHESNLDIQIFNNFLIFWSF